MKSSILLFFCSLYAMSAFGQQGNSFAEDQLILHFKSEITIDAKHCQNAQKFELTALDKLNSQFEVGNIRLTGNKNLEDTYLLNFQHKQDINKLIDTYYKTGLFEYVEPNYIGFGGGKQGFYQTFPNDTYFSRQYSLYNDGSFTNSPAVDDADIDMELAWDIEQGDSSIIVAILDSGVKLDHPEFDGRIWLNRNESSDNTDTDNNGYIDDNMGWDFAYDDNIPADDYGHGTNVAGIIGANANNNIGYAGVDWNCKLMICKILDVNNYGLYSWWAEAIYYAVDNGADVINMSVGGSGLSATLQDAVDYAYMNDVTIVACMMNYDNNVPYYPAGFPNTIAVGSTDANDQRSSPFFWDPTSGSNYGPHIDVVAPGNYIYGLRYNSNTNYNSYWGGTSQATPHVAGLSALLLSQNPNRTPDDIREIIRNTAEDQIGNVTEDVMGFDQYYGYGRLNAHDALLYTPTDVKDETLPKDQISIYPNPTSGTLFLEGIADFDRISLVDLQGKTVYSRSISESKHSSKIDISNLNNGFYLIKLFNSSGQVILTDKVLIE